MRKNTTIHKLVRMGMDNIMHHLVLQRGVNASLRVKRCVPTREMRQFLKLLTILPGSTGLGPSTGINQFGIFLLNGAVGRVKDNIITEGACGTLSPTECFNLRSE